MEISFRKRGQGLKVFRQRKPLITLIEPLITLINLIFLIRIPDILIFANDDFIVLNKPSGLLSIPDREGKEMSLKKILLEKWAEIFTIHRLDKGTSGLIVFAKNESA